MIPADFDEATYLAANPDVAAAVAAGHFPSGWTHYQWHGLREGRAGQPASEPMRVTKAMGRLKRDGRGLEIGPSYNPMAPKRRGYDVKVVDHLETAALRDKFSAEGHRDLDPGLIEEVDFVWRGEPLAVLAGAAGPYDWIVASHVIEHLPDLVGFLQQCDLLLKPEGALSLVVPDRRYCFDHFNPESSTGELLDAWVQKRGRPSPGKLFDHIANVARRGGAVAWDASTDTPFALGHHVDDAGNLWREALKSEHYHDIHSWRFTPDSFRLIVSDLRGLGLVPFAPLCEYDTTGCEFHVTLVRSADAPAVDRLQVLKAIRRQG